MILIIDNYGSSANILASMVRGLGLDVELCSDDMTGRDVRAELYKCVILSSGPGEGGRGLSAGLIRSARGISILAICQSMNLAAVESGARLSASEPLFCEDTLSHTGEGLFRGIPQRFRVVMRQSQTIVKTSLPAVFEAEAYSSNGSIQGISCAERSIYGLGFDPAAYRTEYGLELLRNFTGL